MGRAGERGSNADLIQQGQRVRGWWGEVLNCLIDEEGDWFASSLFRKVGSGSNTSFWEDLWVRDVNLRSTFPRLFALSSDKSCTVAEAGEWIDNRWVWGRGWRREMRAWELESLSKLTDLLKCRKSVSSAPDLWLWKPEPNNTYRVKSAYNVLLDRKLEVNNDIKKTCNLIWSNCVVPKVQATAWRVIFRRIATKAELRRRGIPFQQTGVGCPLCDGPKETIDHLFVECRCVWTLWSSCLDWIGFQAPLINRIPVNFLHFCSLAQDKRKQTWLAALWCCTVWTTWRKRNAIVFCNGVWNHDKIFGEIKSFMWSWGVGKEAYMKPSMSFNCWSKNPLS